MVDFTFSASSISKPVFLLTPAGNDTCNNLATNDSVVPCNNTDVTEIKKTKLKMRSAFGICASNGYVAKTIGTLPRSPTHDTNNLLRVLDLKNEREINTPIGLATKIKNALIIKPIPSKGKIREGNTNNPS